MELEDCYGESGTTKPDAAILSQVLASVVDAVVNSRSKVTELVLLIGAS